MNKFINTISATSFWVLFYCMFVGGSVSAQKTIGFSLANASINEKDTFSIIFKADSVLTGRNIYSYRFGLSFNADYIEFLSIEQAGTVLGTWGLPSTNNKSKGVLLLAGAGTSALSGSGNMFKINFRALVGGTTYVQNIAAESYLNEGTPSLILRTATIQCASRSYPDIYPDSQTLYIGDEVQMNTSGGIAPYVYKTVDTAVAVISGVSKVRAKGPGTTKVYVTDSRGDISYTSGVMDIRAVKLSVVHSTAWPNENFLIPVRIEIAPGTKVFSGSFDLNFNGNIQGISANSYQGDFSVSVQNKAFTNLVRVTFASATGITGSGVICYVGFKAVNSGNHYVSISSALFNESLLALTYNEYAEVYYLPVLSISPNSGNLMWGSTQKITVTNGTPPITYEVSDTAKANIDALGNLYVKSGGKVKVKVTDSHGATQTSNDFLIYHNQFSITSTDGVLDKDTRVPIVTTQLPQGNSLFSFNGTITFDTTYLKFVRVDPGVPGMLVEAVKTNGTLNIVGASGSGITSGIMCNLIFRIKNTLAINSLTNVTLSGFVGNEGEYFSTLVSGKVKRVTQVSYRPVAIAGANIRINEGLTVTLDGSASYDDDNNPLTFSWISPAGIKLNDSTLKKPQFVAPQVNANTNYIFTLIVNDGTSDSDPSNVTVTVLQINKPPVANAGADRSYTEGSTVSLDGGSSYDQDGEAVSFQWTSLDGIILFDSKSVTPSFIAPQVNSDTKYRFRLIVFDGVAYSQADTVSITSLQVNKKPVAFAGSDVTVNEGVKVFLDGSLSSDPDGNAITYLWTAPSNVTLSSRTISKPTFTAPPVHRDSTLTISLVVNDGLLNSETDNVIITIKNIDILSQASQIKKGNLTSADSVTVNQSTLLVTVYMPYGADIRALSPTFTLSDKATISPLSGSAHDFTNPVPYTVTAEDGFTKTVYLVKVNVPDISLSRTLNAGWNWISMSVEPSNTSVTSVFTGLSLANLDYVKSTTASSVYYTGSGWFGDLVSLPVSEMVKMKKSTSQKFTLAGKQINPTLTAIPVTTGWNRIGYLLKGNTPINSSFDKSTLPTGNILLKSKEASAAYYPLAGWIGDLDSMKVLNGYMMKTEANGNIKYNPAGVKQKSMATSAALYLRTDLYTLYNIHPSEFENSANLIGEYVNEKGENITHMGDLLIAFIDGEARGVTEAVFIADINKYVFFISIFSNARGNITFGVKPVGSSENTPIAETYIFAADAVFGAPFTPVQLHSVATGLHADSKSVVTIYPNPVSDHLMITSGTDITRISVYSPIGKCLQVVSDASGNTRRINTSNLTSGMYTVKIETKNGVEIRKFVK